MKKLVLMFVAVAAISFASCGGNQPKAENVDSTTVAEPDTTVQVDTTAAQADTTVAE